MTDTAFPFDSDEGLEYTADSPWTHTDTITGEASTPVGSWYGDTDYRLVWHGVIDMSEWAPPSGEDLSGLAVRFFVIDAVPRPTTIGIYGADYDDWGSRTPLGTQSSPPKTNAQCTIEIPKSVLEDALEGSGVVHVYADIPNDASADYAEIGGVNHSNPDVRPHLIVATTPVGGGQPSAVPAIVSVTPSHDSADVVISYSGDDADGFEYRIDEGSPVDVEDDLSFSIPGLSSATQYDLQVRAYNSNGPGEWSEPYPFETLAEPEVHSVQAASVTMSSIVPKCVARDETDIVFIVTGRTPGTMTRAQALAILAEEEE